jgi:phenylalanyl-tRNA synthetase alpha chain
MSVSLESLVSELEKLRSDFDNDLKNKQTAANPETLRIKYLGRKGLISGYFKRLSELEPGDRPVFGNSLNALKTDVQNSIDALQQGAGAGVKKDRYVDLTLPGILPEVGFKNPLLQIYDEIITILCNMGFSIETGPLIETEYYNFQALNFPEDHPSKDLQDTLYLKGGLLLRTHTSPVQIRTMEKQKPPVRMIAPGRCFRKDAPDATHSPEFTQIEGLVIDRDISFADLKGTLMAFAKKLFGSQTRVRFRPSFFPFTEPSAEMDVWWESARGGKWLEILGCGMVDPNVLAYVDYDSEVYTGFAWGMGVERIAMMKYQIDDIRHFYDNDFRFLAQF